MKRIEYLNENITEFKDNKSNELNESVLANKLKTVKNNIGQKFDNFYNGFKQIDNPQNIEEVFTGNGWKVNKVEHPTNNTFIVILSRKTGVSGGHYGLPIYHNHDYDICDAVTDYFKEVKHKDVIVDYLPSYMELKPYQELIKITF